MCPSLLLVRRCKYEIAIFICRTPRSPRNTLVMFDYKVFHKQKSPPRGGLFACFWVVELLQFSLGFARKFV